MITIDGEHGEGGGQILRTACALSAATGIPCRVFNIRKKRKKPGLARQHLAGIRALNKLANGKLEGDRLRSRSIVFYPGKIQGEKIEVEIKTAGSITLVLQALLLPSLFGEEATRIKFKGGATDTFFSPSIDHFRYVLLGVLEKLGVRAEVDIGRRGFYPKGGAEVEVEIHPGPLNPLSLTEPGGLERVVVISGATKNLKRKKVAERQISGVKQALGKLNLPLEQKIEYYKARSTGSQINIIAYLENTVLGVDNLGKMGKSAEVVGEEAGRRFIQEAQSKACLDKYAADQILPYLALAPGKSEVSVSEITPHCKTNIWVIQKFIEGDFEIKENIIVWNPGS